MPQRPERQPGFEQRIDERGLHRLHFSVPRPMARVNLGMPWFERLRGTTFDNATRRFGYRGVSLQSDYHLFTHVAKDTLIHTGKITQLQTGKNWLQYTGGSQWIATKKDATFAASKRVTIVAGAGQGPKSPIRFGMDVRPDREGDSSRATRRGRALRYAIRSRCRGGRTARNQDNSRERGTAPRDGASHRGPRVAGA